MQWIDQLLGNPMPQTKIDAFFQEFPWLIMYVSPQTAKCLFVKRVESGMLLCYPETAIEKVYFNDWYRNRRDEWGSTIHQRKAVVFFLDAKGEKLLQVGEREVIIPAHTIPARTAGWFRKARAAIRVPEKREWQYGLETIESAIKRLSEMDDVNNRGYFILSVLRSTDYGALVTIYKAPKGYDLISWIATELERERQAIQVECSRIDADAEKVTA